MEKVLIFRGNGFNNCTILKTEEDAFDNPSIQHGWKTYTNVTVDGIFYRCRVDFPIGKIQAPVAIDKSSTLNRKSEIGFLAYKMNMLLSCEPLNTCVLKLALILPVCEAIFCIYKAAPVDKIFKFSQGHPGILCISLRWVERNSPAQSGRCCALFLRLYFILVV